MRRTLIRNADLVMTMEPQLGDRSTRADSRW